MFVVSFTSLVEYFYPSGKWRRINKSLHYMATQRHYTDIALTSEQCTTIQRLFTKDRQTIVVRKWNNMDKCCSI